MLKKVADEKPDVVLMDLKMPGIDGVEATRRIQRDHPEMSVIILSSFSGDAHLVQAMEAGAKGYVLKDTKAETMVDTILAVTGGTKVMSTAVADRLTPSDSPMICHNSRLAKTADSIAKSSHRRMRRPAYTRPTRPVRQAPRLWRGSSAISWPPSASSAAGARSVWSSRTSA